jgi:hypothetical protein
MSNYFSATGTTATLAAEAAAAFDLQHAEASFDLSQEAADLVQALGADSLLTVLASAEAEAVLDLQQEPVVVAAVLLQLFVSLLTVCASAVVEAEAVFDLQQAEAVVDFVQDFVVSAVLAAFGHCAYVIPANIIIAKNIINCFIAVDFKRLKIFFNVNIF